MFKYFTSGRQGQLFETADIAPACAVRMTIQETVEALVTGELVQPIPELGRSDIFKMPKPCKSYITDARQTQLMDACELGDGRIAIEQACVETAAAFHSGIPAGPVAETLH